MTLGSGAAGFLCGRGHGAYPVSDAVPSALE